MNRKRLVRCLSLSVVSALLAGIGCSWSAWGATHETDSQAAGIVEPVPAPEVPPAERLVDLLVSEEPRGTRLVLIGDGELGNFNAFALEDPPRIVVDMWHVRSALARMKIPVGSREVARVRIGSHPEKVRLVFDLAEGLEGFPSYSLRKDHGKLLLCLGEMAAVEDRQGEIYEPPAAATARASGLEPVSRHSGGPPPEPKIQASPAPVMDESTWNLVELEDFEEAWSELYTNVEEEMQAPASWSEAKSREIGKTAPQTATPPQLAQRAPTLDAALEESVVRAPEESEELKIASVEAPDSPSSSRPLGAARPAPLEEAAVPAQMASLARVTPSLEEQAEEFPISTGMEPGKVYVGQRVNLDFQDIDIHNVFRLLAEVSNLNIIVSDKVKGKVTMRLKDIPWDQALDVVLSTQNLGMVRQGNVIRVAPLKDLIAEEKERRRLRQERLQELIEAQNKLREEELRRQEQEKKARPFETKAIVLNYTDPKQVESQIKGFISKPPDAPRQGRLVVDDRTKTLTIEDYPEKIEIIEEYIKRIDKPTPQVLIEARIVKASKNFARELGVQWGGQYVERGGGPDDTWAWGLASGVGGATPTSFVPRAWTPGTPGPQGTIPTSGWAVNLPATQVLSPAPGIGFQVGRLMGDLLNLDLRLSAAEQEGETRIISRPKIMTLDNVEATIKQGREIPFTQVNPEGNVSVVFKEAQLTTTVTPLISPDGRIRLKLDVTDDFPDRENRNPVTGNPEIVKRQATTEVLVNNGETVVIGGIIQDERTVGSDGVPWFRDVPGLGWLFERKRRNSVQTELLIFVTPFLVEKT